MRFKVFRHKNKWNYSNDVENYTVYNFSSHIFLIDFCSEQNQMYCGLVRHSCELSEVNVNVKFKCYLPMLAQKESVVAV